MTESYGAGQEPLQDLDDVTQMGGSLKLGTSGGLDVIVNVPDGGTGNNALSGVEIYGGTSSQESQQTDLGSGSNNTRFSKTGISYTAGDTFYVRVKFNQGTRSGVTLCGSGSVSRPTTGTNTTGITLNSTNCS